MDADDSATRTDVLQQVWQASRRVVSGNAAAPGTCTGSPSAAGDSVVGHLSAFNTIGGVVLYVLANTLFAHLHGLGAPEAPTAFLRPLLSVIGIFILAKAACGFIAGWGLMQREPWARIIALVLGFISLFNIPFGTAVGVYTLWVLLPAQSQEEYDAMAAARAA